MSHLLEQNLMSPWQSSFCPSHSTTTTLLHITSEWFSALDCGLFDGAIFLDISKAFDTVNHELLLSQLAGFNLDPAACHWFRSYLTDRTQCTAIGHKQSEEVAVTSRVPQGCVLGPLLFSLFVNSLPEHLQGIATVLFADDTTLYVSGHFVADTSFKLSSTLSAANSWLSDSGL